MSRIISVLCAAFITMMSFSFSTSANAADYSVGQSVSIEWSGTWYPGKIIEAKKDSWKIHYDGYGANYDEWVPAKRLKAIAGAKSATTKASAKTAAKPAAKPSSGGSKWKVGAMVTLQLTRTLANHGKVVEVKGSKRLVKFEGYAKPSWVEASKLSSYAKKAKAQRGGKKKSKAQMKAFCAKKRSIGSCSFHKPCSWRGVGVRNEKCVYLGR